MQDFLIKTGIMLLICLPTVVIIAFGIYTGAYSCANEHPTFLDEKELNRREYQTMLRHRRRAKLATHFRKLGMAADMHEM
jgi:hypothetical protein